MGIAVGSVIKCGKFVVSMLDVGEGTRDGAVCVFLSF